MPIYITIYAQLYVFLNLGFLIDFNYPFLHGMNMDLIRVSITNKVRVCNNALKNNSIRVVLLSQSAD